MTERPWSEDQRVRLAVAEMGGTVEHCAERHASTEAEALTNLTEISQRLKLDREQHAEALAHTTAGYLRGDQWYRAAALNLLREAGADMDRAQAIADLRNAQTRIRFGDAEL